MDESKAQNLPLSGGRKDIPVGSGIRISPGDSGTDITAAVLDSTKASKTTNGLCIEDQGMAGCYCRFCNQPLEHLEPRSYNNESSLDRTESVNTNNEAGLFEEIMLGGYDLILNTKSHEETSEDDIGPTVGYGVSSQILRSTSRVFRAMFGPDSGFKETVNVRRAIIGLPASAAVISLDGDSEALGIVLKFLHHRVELLPTKVKFTKLVKIAEICNKYDLRQALKPLIDKLSKPFADKIYETGYEDWLLISYVFGYEDIFTKVSKELILQGILIPQQGFGFGDAGSYRTLSGCTPESVTSKLVKARQFRTDILRQALEEIRTNRTPGPRGPNTKCKQKSNKTECESLEFGYLIMTIARLEDCGSWDCRKLYSILGDFEIIPDVFINGHKCSRPDPYIKGFEYSAEIKACSSSSHARCSWVLRLKAVAESQKILLEGLRLSDFPSSLVACGSTTIDPETELFTRFQPTQVAAPEPQSSALFGNIIVRNTGRAQSPASNVSDEDNLYGDPIQREDSQEDMMHDASDDESTKYSQSDMMGVFQAPDSPPTFYGNGNNSSLNVLGPSPAPLNQQRRSGSIRRRHCD